MPLINRRKMSARIVLSFMLVCLCLGCTSEQWVKEYVKSETSGLQETLNNTLKSQEELKNRQIALERQIKEQIKDTGESLKMLEKKLTQLHEEVSLDREEEEEDIKMLKQEISSKLGRLEDIEKDLNYLKEIKQKGYLEKSRELELLAAQINDAKKFMDMNIVEVLKAQDRLKNFIIEEVRVLRLAHQDYTRELESFKRRLEALENTIGITKVPER
jgi:DNA repair exonuclease SbcCD ATPase subunit